MFKKLKFDLNYTLLILSYFYNKIYKTKTFQIVKAKFKNTLQKYITKNYNNNNNKTRYL